MANPFFRFKQFTVHHDKCAMKVGTDGVLLGAWADLRNVGSILDVGTGTGLIALMLAQRSEALIEAIDIDQNAYLQACENVLASPFAEQITVTLSAFADFRPTGKYDLIVSNPPYFSQSLKSPDAQRSKARHDDHLPLEELIAQSQTLLSEKGRIALILPVEQEERLNKAITQYALFRVRQTNVCPVVGGPVRRILVELSPVPCTECTPDSLSIEIERHQYSEAYKTLTRAYYLNM